MQVGGAGLVGAALPAAVRSVEATPSNLPGSTTINLGDQGLSPGDDIGPYFDQYADDDTNLVIPGDDSDPPQYGFDRDVDLTYSDAALVGDGMVELVRPDGSANTFRVYAGSGRTMLANVTVRGTLCECDEKSRVRAQSGGKVEIRNVRMPDGGYGSSSNDVGSGWYVKAGHAGEALFCDCYVEGFPDNGFYASVPGSSSGDGGRVVFDGCKTRNNNVSGIRVGSDDSVVKNCAIVNDAQAPRVPAGREMRGLRIKQPGDGITVENVHVTNVYDGSGAGAAIEIDSDSAGGSGSFSDVFVENDSPDPVVEREITDWTVTAESNVHLTGANTDDGGFFGSPCVGSGCTSPSTSAPTSDCGDGSGGGGDDAEEVAEDFSHDDVAGTYNVDTGSFTTTSARSTTGSFSLRADDDADSNEIVLREDMETTAGNTYTLDVFFESASDTDVGFLFGAQDGVTGYGTYDGYVAFMDSNEDRIELARKTDGTDANTASTATTWPTGEWLTVELDYRDGDSGTITMTVFDAADDEIASVSLADTTYDGGAIGFYNWFAAADWHVDSWFQDDHTAGAEVAEDFSHDDVAGTYNVDTGSFTTTSAHSTTGSFSLRADDDADSNEIVLREDVETSAGNTYTLDVFFESASDTDVSFLFGVQDATAGYGEFDGYSAFMDSNEGEIRLERKTDGSIAATASTATTWPTGEWLTVELDYRDTDAGTITMTVFDASDAEVASVSLDDTAYDAGGIGFYNWFAAADWHVDSWFDAADVPAKVMDDFDHDDVAGTYNVDTGSFTTTSARSTTGSFSLRADDDADSNEIVLRDDKKAVAGNTYALDVYFESASDTDVGFLFGAQDATAGYGSYDGYVAFMDSNEDRIELARKTDGTDANTASTATTWPTGEWLTVELDYRDADAGTITMTVFDASDAEVASVSLDDTAYDAGGFGFYNWFAAADWHVDSWDEL